MKHTYESNWSVKGGSGRASSYYNKASRFNGQFITKEYEVTTQVI